MQTAADVEKLSQCVHAPQPGKRLPAGVSRAHNSRLWLWQPQTGDGQAAISVQKNRWADSHDSTLGKPSWKKHMKVQWANEQAECVCQRLRLCPTVVAAARRYDAVQCLR